MSEKPPYPLEDVALLTAVLDAFPMRVFWKDRESRYLGANIAFARDAGLTDPRALIGKTDHDMPWKPEEADFFRLVDQRVMDSGNAEYHILEPIRMASGQDAWLETNKVPLRGAGGEIIGILGTYEDVTARKAEEEELRANRNRLEHLVAERTAELEFTARQLRDEIAHRESSSHERERLQQQIIETQQRAIAELAVPVIPIVERVLVVPLVSYIDALRAKEISRAVLAGIAHQRARAIVVDVTNVPGMDSEAARDLHRALRLARLKGAQPILCGVCDAVAETMVDLGIDGADLLIVNDLQSGVLVALESAGIRLVRPETAPS